MRTFFVPYGTDHLELRLPETALVDWIDPVDLPAPQGSGDLVCAALDTVIGAPSLEAFRSARSVAIAINDKTRPVPHDRILPPLLERLDALGLGPATRFYIATGTHAPMLPGEFSSVLPESILSRYPVVSHDCDDQNNLQFLGSTSRGTPIWVNRAFYQSDLKIVLGTIEPHHFAGFSGGYKTAAIGLAGRETIAANHAMLIDPHSRLSEFDQNPLRQDIEEIGEKIGVQYALNVRLNGEKEVLAAYFGGPAHVLRSGMPETRAATETRVQSAYDLVITSPGGHPKDINFYQAQKAMTPAAMMTRDGGTVILAAACPEGIGSPGYETFMEGVNSMDGVLEKFRAQGFRLGAHKALLVALIARRVRLIVVSSMPPEMVGRLLLTPASDLSAALALAGADSPAQSRIAILPHGATTVPVITGGEG